MVLCFGGRAAEPGRLDPQSVISAGTQLLIDEEPQQAYELLLSHEDNLADNNDYNYLLGLSAVDSGNFDMAVMALQRILLLDPNNLPARMELGRAYFGLNEVVLARYEFEQLAAQSPPPLAKRVINDYLDRIKSAEGRYETRKAGYFELGGGYSNNANAATSAATFQGFQLDDNSRRQSSAVFAAAAGGQVTKPLTPRWKLMGTGRLSLTNYPDASDIDSLLTSASLHLQWQRDRRGVRGGLTGRNVRLDGDYNNESVSADISGWLPVHDQWLLRANMRYALLRHTENLSVRDVDQQYYGVSLSHANPGKRQWFVDLGVIGGREDGVRDNAQGQRPFGRDVFGLRASTSLFLNVDLRLAFSSSWLHSFYDGPLLRDDGTSSGRTDDQFINTMALVLPELPKFEQWALRNEFRYIENRSDISLYQYNSFQVLFTLRREFD